MSCIERTAKVLMVLAIVVLVCNLAINIYFCYAAPTDTWFTKCKECKAPKGNGTVDCNQCCQDCTKTDEVYFYVMRAYNFIFIIIGIVAELRIEKFDECFKACVFMLPRGFMHIFIGVLTVTASLPNQSSAAYIAIGGYALMGVGIVHFLAGFLCYNEYDSDSRDKEVEMRRNGGGSKASEPRPTAAGPTSSSGPSAYEYKYNGQTYNYGANAAGPSAI